MMDIPNLNIQYPSYVVETPQTGKKVELRALNISQEEKLKASYVDQEDMASLTDILNQTIFSSIAKKEEGVSDNYLNFLKNFTMADREALFVGLTHASYDNTHDYTATCPKCRKQFDFKVNLDEGFSYNKSETSLLEKPIEFELPESKLKVVYSAPSLQKELNVYKNYEDIITTSPTYLNIMLYIDNIKYIPEGGKNYKTITDKLDILNVFKMLRPNDYKAFKKDVEDKIEQYRSNLAYNVKCPHCSNKFEFSVNVVQEFFRLVL
jgi:hypothetical protein